MSSSESLKVGNRLDLRLDGSVATITLAHPPLNVIDLRMMEELASALMDVESRTEVACVVLRGAGKAFSAGVDIPAHRPETIAEMLGKFHAVVRALAKSSKVTVAQVHGACLGGGAELAMVCDMVYTARDASWGFPEIKLACFPPVAVAALSKLVGQRRASELILTGRQISGAEAAAIGLATGTADEEHLDELVRESVGRIAELSPAALALTKKSLGRLDFVEFDESLARAEEIYKCELMKTQDSREGIAAWMEKRQPRWAGK